MFPLSILYFLSGLGYTNTVEGSFITASPSDIPTATPVTSRPTATPSITGLVIYFTASTDVTQTVPDDIVQDMKDSIIAAYGVTEDDVTMEENYVSSGSIQLELDENSDFNQIEIDMAKAIADAVGVSPSQLEVSINPINGVAEFKVKSVTTFCSNLQMKNAFATV